MSTQKHVTDEQLLYFGQQVAGKEKELRDAEVVKLVAKEDGKSLISAEDLAQITTNKTNIETLVGEDTGKSARAISAEELAKQLIPENAKESLNTLTEIAAWIQQHPDDASAMNLSIENVNAKIQVETDRATAAEQANADAITALNGDDTVEGSVAYKIKEATKDLAKFSDVSTMLTEQYNGLNSKINDNTSRLDTLEADMSTPGSVDYKINAALESMSIETATNEDIDNIIATIYGTTEQGA